MRFVESGGCRSLDLDVWRDLQVPGRRLVTAAPAPYALFVLTRKLSMYHKPTVNARVVVVGASETGLACMEHLLKVSARTVCGFAEALYRNSTEIEKFKY